MSLIVMFAALLVTVQGELNSLQGNRIIITKLYFLAYIYIGADA